MIKRTTVELDEELLVRAKRALGRATTRGVIEESLRRAADEAESDAVRRAQAQRLYLKTLSDQLDLAVLSSEVMWR